MQELINQQKNNEQYETELLIKLANESPPRVKILNNETQKTGIIYCITNVLNGKRYFGQTISYRRLKKKTFKAGMSTRYKDHLRYAKNGSNCIPKLYRAIRKYGIGAFICNQIVICDKSDLDDFETYYIKLYETYTEKGYNIVIHRCEHTEVTKKAIRDGHRKRRTPRNRKVQNNKNLPLNIYKNPKGRGYNLKIVRDNLIKSITINEYDKTDEELLELAIKKRDSIIQQMEKSNTVDHHVKEKDHNGNELPVGLNKFSAHDLEGYTARIERNSRVIIKKFVNKNDSMEKKLKLATEKLKYLENNFDDEIIIIDANVKKNKNRLDHNGEILPECISKMIKGNSEGYQVCFRNKGKRKSNSFTEKTKTMDEKLQQAKYWLQKNKQFKGQSAGSNLNSQHN